MKTRQRLRVGVLAWAAQSNGGGNKDSGCTILPAGMAVEAIETKGDSVVVRDGSLLWKVPAGFLEPITEEQQ